MTLTLGVDTGGTYTDAVLIADGRDIVASAKSLTTRGDLSLGIGRAIDAVLHDADCVPGDVSLVSLSTTLATNALVEGQGGRIGLVFAGFDPRDLKRQGLEEALAGDPVLYLTGGHDHTGNEAHPLDFAALENWLKDTAPEVSAFAVAAQFAVRNPAHEIAMRDLIRAQTGLPVSASHDLSARLGGPKRATTAVLNARLIGLIDRLIGSMSTLLDQRGLMAPLMVVRGDGALIAAEIAREKPIETILSGPAASLVGAAWLTGERDALVSDIGGTTTDVALLKDGRPRIDSEGARVGGFRTMVEAVAMRTSGLGGDSAVVLSETGLTGSLSLGPRRRVPVAILASDFPDVVHPALEAQLAEDRSGEHDGLFWLRVPGPDPAGLRPRETEVLARLADAPRPQGEVVRTRLDLSALQTLRARGAVLVSGATPTDAAHVLGLQHGFDQAAAHKALQLIARVRGGSGQPFAESADALAKSIVSQLHHQSAELLLSAALAEDGFEAPEQLVAHTLAQTALRPQSGLTRIAMNLQLPVVGLGASAGVYYGPIGERLGCPTILPDAGGVANAIGAVVGQVTVRRSLTVSSPSEGLFRLHEETGPRDFTDQGAALSAAETVLRHTLHDAARAAGASEAHVEIVPDIRMSNIEGRDMFVEAELKGEATGRPRIAMG